MLFSFSVESKMVGPGTDQKMSAPEVRKTSYFSFLPNTVGMLITKNHIEKSSELFSKDTGFLFFTGKGFVGKQCRRLRLQFGKFCRPAPYERLQKTR